MAGYIADVSREDMTRLDGTSRDPDGVRRVLTSPARNVATPTTVQSITSDAAGADGSIKIETVRTYLAGLARLMITDDIPAWKPSMRSRSRLRASWIRHLADPAPAAAAMGATPVRLLRDLNYKGYLFESMVVRDLRAYAEAEAALVYHYRDEKDLEVDAIVELPDGRWAGFEIKLGSSPEVTDIAAAQLLKLRDKVGGEPPIALGVITGTGYGFTRAGGRLQIPIGALGP
jgi:predicted AAA+ superfamily ATPase